MQLCLDGYLAFARCCTYFSSVQSLEYALSSAACWRPHLLLMEVMLLANLQAATLYNSLGNSCTDEEFAPLQKLHANLQPLLHLFIDGASSIEQDDPNWELFLASQGGQGSFQVVSRCIKGRLHARPGPRPCAVTAQSLASASCAC